MEYGFKVPPSGSMSTPEALATLARRGEEMGFGLIAVSDHVAIPRAVDSRFPYTESGEFPGVSGVFLEQLTLLSFLAGQTSKIRLLPSIMILPHRGPVLAAKVLASIDVLSQGRLIVGCAAGWLKAEFEALGAPPYDERGAVASEYIRVFKELWTNDSPTFASKYVRFSDVSFEPKPAQKPHPPIWVGGETPPAMRRAAELGDCWYPIGTNPKIPINTPGQFSDSLARLRGYAEDAGRDPSEIDVAYSSNWIDDPDGKMRVAGDRLAFAGTVEQVAGDIRDFEQAGLRHLVLGFPAPTLDETLDRMERFIADVVPLV